MEGEEILLPAFSNHKDAVGRPAPASMILAEILFTIGCIWTLTTMFNIDRDEFTIPMVIVLILLWGLKIFFSNRADKGSKDKNEFTVRLYKYMIVCQWLFTAVAIYLYVNALHTAFETASYTKYLKVVDASSYAYYLFAVALLNSLLFAPLVIKRRRTPEMQYADFSVRVMRLVNMIDKARGTADTYKKEDFKRVRKNGGL